MQIRCATETLDLIQEVIEHDLQALIFRCQLSDRAMQGQGIIACLRILKAGYLSNLRGPFTKVDHGRLLVFTQSRFHPIEHLALRLLLKLSH
jgi:hypothetical protein